MSLKNDKNTHTRTLTSDHVIVGKYNENTSLENFCTYDITNVHHTFITAVARNCLTYKYFHTKKHLHKPNDADDDRMNVFVLPFITSPRILREINASSSCPLVAREQLQLGNFLHCLDTCDKDHSESLR